MAIRVAAAPPESCRQLTGLNERDARPQMQALRKVADGHTIRHLPLDKRGFGALSGDALRWAETFWPFLRDFDVTVPRLLIIPKVVGVVLAFGAPLGLVFVLSRPTDLRIRSGVAS